MIRPVPSAGAVGRGIGPLDADDLAEPADISR